MKICMISPTLPLHYRRDGSARVGGSEVQAAFLAGALDAAGHEVQVVTVSLRSEDRVPFKTINAYYSDKGIPGLRFFYPRVPGVLRALARADADLYYQRNASMLTGITGMFCRHHGKVFVYGSGSDTDFWFWAARMDNFRDRCLYYMGLKLAHGVIVQNEFQKQRYSEKHSGPVRVIANGINVADSDPEVERDLILWMGGLRRIKRPELFLELARRVPGRKFVLLGGDVGVDRGFAERIRKEAGAIPNLIHPGHVPHAEVGKYLRRALVLVNTSRVEGFPNAYLEAWSHGVPVVTFNDVDGMVENHKLGVVCDGIEDMEDALRSVLADADTRTRTGTLAREYVIEHFSASVLGRQYLDFFEELAAKNQPR